MARETLCFEHWLSALEAETPRLPLTEALDHIARSARQAWGAHLCFVERLGRRWSHIAGRWPDRPVDGPVSRIPLAAGVGVVVSLWGDVKPEDRQRLLDFLRDLIGAKDTTR